MRILLTGVNGQVGGALRSPLQAFGTVLEADRQTLDLSRTGAISGVLDRLAPDLIVNPAAYTAVDRAEDERELAYRVNADAVAQIARLGRSAARAARAFFDRLCVRRLGRSVLGARTIRPMPLSVYGASKLAGEDAIRAAGGPHLIVRTSWVYAARGTQFSAHHREARAERKELRIVADQIGAPTSARAIADAVCAIIRRQLGGFTRGPLPASAALSMSRAPAKPAGMVSPPTSCADCSSATSNSRLRTSSRSAPTITPRRRHGRKIRVWI